MGEPLKPSKVRVYRFVCIYLLIYTSADVSIHIVPLTSVRRFPSHAYSARYRNVHKTTRQETWMAPETECDVVRPQLAITQRLLSGKSSGTRIWWSDQTFKSLSLYMLLRPWCRRLPHEHCDTPPPPPRHRPKPCRNPKIANPKQPAALLNDLCPVENFLSDVAALQTTEAD